MERVLEIAASTRVLRERRLYALERAPGAVLGREFVTFRGLAERCAAETDTPVRALLGGPGLADLAALCARGKGTLGERLADRPRLAGALSATLRDLRDARIPPRELRRAAPELAETYTSFEDALARLGRERVFDRVGLFRLALGGAREYLARRGFTAIEVHGASELVGSVGDLLAAAADALPGAFRFFQPDFQSDFGERLRAEWPWGFAPQAVEVVDLPALAPGDAPAADALVVRRARSPRAELDGVARDVLGLLDRGVPAHEILIAARSLEPYAPWLGEIFGGYGIPFTSSLRVPRASDPAERAWLDLVRVLTRDLGRASLVRLLGAPGLRASGADPAEIAALGERIARETAVVRGESDWRAALSEAPAGRPRDQLERIVGLLADGARALEGATDFGGAARVVGELGAGLFGEGSATRDWLEAVALLDAARASVGAVARPSREELRGAFEAELLEASSTPFAEDGGGVRVLDAVQARALPCSHLYLVGMVHGAWPRPLAEDPFLPDALRAELRARLRRPVPLRGAVDAEDRFLLGLLLSQARERVVLSFPESDSAGRAQSPSALLRQLPFVAPGTDAVTRVEAWEETGRGFVRLGEALARETDPESAAALAARLRDRGAETWAAGLELVARTDELTAESLPYDGQVGAALALTGPLSPSAVEALGACPLRALFERLLRARPLESPGADELEANEAGNFVHKALDSLYSELFARGALSPGTPVSAALEQARAALPAALARAEGEQRSRVQKRHPTAWRAFRGMVERALEDFLRRDLPALLPQGVERLDTERPFDALLRVGAESLQLGGKIDRIVGRADGSLWVGDYKTSRQFDRPLQGGRIRKGLSLQIPLYVRMVRALEGGAEINGEALTVPLRPERDRDGDRAEERTSAAIELEKLSEPPLQELVALLREGFFPTSAHVTEACRWCPYTVACRVNHPPSRARVASSPLALGYLALGRKAT